MIFGGSSAPDTTILRNTVKGFHTPGGSPVREVQKRILLAKEQNYLIAQMLFRVSGWQGM
jgi:hypothetical protein